MPLKPVAKTGDTTKTKGMVMFTGASSGAWTPDLTITETAYPLPTIGGVGVIHAASCGFSFAGFAADGTTPVNGSSTVTLTAASTTLQKGSTFALRDGDTTQDAFGNTLTVVATNILRSD